MKMYLCFAAVLTLWVSVVVCQEVLNQEQTEQAEEKFIEDLGKSVQQGGSDDSNDNGSSRKRRSIRGALDAIAHGGARSDYVVRSPVRNYAGVLNRFYGGVPSALNLQPAGLGVRGADYYYQAPTRGAGFGYYYNSPGYASSTFYNTQDRAAGVFSPVNFVQSFTPLRAYRTSDNVFVRNYVRFGSVEDCMGDFNALEVTDVQAVHAEGFADNNFGLLGNPIGGVRVLASRSIKEADVHSSVRIGGRAAYNGVIGYVGALRNSPYKVFALRNACEVDGYSGFHDCIIFSGASYPYTKSERRFVYVDESLSTSGLTVDGAYLNGGVRRSAVYGDSVVSNGVVSNGAVYAGAGYQGGAVYGNGVRTVIADGPRSVIGQPSRAFISGPARYGDFAFGNPLFNRYAGLRRGYRYV